MPTPDTRGRNNADRLQEISSTTSSRRGRNVSVILLFLLLPILTGCSSIANQPSDFSLSATGTPSETGSTQEIDPPVTYSAREKIANRPSVPVFYPWPSGCGQPFWFDCDLEETPYSLIWTSEGINPDIASPTNLVTPEQKAFMQSDPDTLYLVNEEWHYWNTGWRSLSPFSEFYLLEIFKPHLGSEYGLTLMIDFLNPDWPGVLAEKAANFQEAGYDGMIFDWWHDQAGNGRDQDQVRSARVAIASAIREHTGDDFILMGNVNWTVDDPTAEYLSGVYLELWKPDTSASYPIRLSDEKGDSDLHSIEQMEELLEYWDEHLHPPRIIAFEPWKVTREDYIADRSSKENLQWVRLYTAMALVIPENGYILYADNNEDWEGGDHQHEYYDLYRLDLGQPASGRIEIRDGAGYKLFENGLIAYNRLPMTIQHTLPDGFKFSINSLDGVFISFSDK